MTAAVGNQTYSRAYVEWRYLPRGLVAHALDTASEAAAICGASAGHGDYWLGTGTQDEYERAATLPECRRCAARLR